MLDNSFDPSSFLALVLDIYRTSNYSSFFSKQKELVILALKKGADPNRLTQTDNLDGLHLNIMNMNSKILALLFNNEYKKNRTIFVDMVLAYIFSK